MSPNARLLATCGLLLPCLGCDDVSWPDREYVDSVRILGVRAEPPSLTPGASTQLSVHCADGRRGPTADPSCDLEVAWFAECNNPPDNDPKKCLRNYATWTKRLSESIADTPSDAWPRGFGIGNSFDFQAPKTILSDEFQAMNQTLHFGISYVFFAACAGRLASKAGGSDRLPVECHDRKTGQPLGQPEFTVGYTTIHSYDLLANKNPELLNRSIDGVAIPSACSAAVPCPEGFACDGVGSCAPVLKACNRSQPENCQGHCFGFQLSRASFALSTLDGTLLAAPMKSIWVNSFTNAGLLLGDAEFGVKPVLDDGEATRGNCLGWRTPPMPTENAHIWAVIRDDYGGLTVWDQHVIVR